MISRIQRLAWFLEAHFRQSCICTDEPEQGEDSHEPSLLVQLKDEADALINLFSMTVTSTNEALKKRVEAVLDMALSTVSSLNEAFTSGIPMSTKEAIAEVVKENSSYETTPSLARDSKANEDTPFTKDNDGETKPSQDDAPAEITLRAFPGITLHEIHGILPYGPTL